MINSTFFAGLEEIASRLTSLIVTILFFTIYVASKSFLTLDWQSFVIHLIIFWFVYELISYILFLLFRFFAVRSQANQQTSPDTIQPDEHNE